MVLLACHLRFLLHLFNRKAATKTAIIERVMDAGRIILACVTSSPPFLIPVIPVVTAFSDTGMDVVTCSVSELPFVVVLFRTVDVDVVVDAVPLQDSAQFPHFPLYFPFTSTSVLHQYLFLLSHFLHEW